MGRPARHRWTASALAALTALAVGCASGPRARVAAAVDRGDLDEALEAYDDFRRTEGADAQVLARPAALLLERELDGADEARRRAALLQLSLAGTAGAPVLRRVAARDELSPARLGALEILARRGDEQARLTLRALADSDDLEVVAASVLGMDPELDRDLLLSLTRSPHPGVRAAALGALAPRAEEAEVLRALSEAARVDPDVSVRSAAVRALGRGGEAAVGALRERLSDPESGVRLAAVNALTRADPERARGVLMPLLGVAPSPAGIEAARLLSVPPPEQAEASEASAGAEGEAGAPHVEQARAYLRRVLRSPDAELRSQAGVALAGLPPGADPPTDAIREALAAEPDADVRLSLARALWRTDQEAAREALERLLEAEGMPRVQAATLLASDGSERAREVLQQVVAASGESIIRRTAARGLARDAMDPDAARSALRDPDPMVRIYAAGGILAAAAAG